MRNTCMVVVLKFLLAAWTALTSSWVRPIKARVNSPRIRSAKMPDRRLNTCWCFWLAASARMPINAINRGIMGALNKNTRVTIQSMGRMTMANAKGKKTAEMVAGRKRCKKPSSACTWSRMAVVKAPAGVCLLQAGPRASNCAKNCWRNCCLICSEAREAAISPDQIIKARKAISRAMSTICPHKLVGGTDKRMAWSRVWDSTQAWHTRMTPANSGAPMAHIMPSGAIFQRLNNQRFWMEASGLEGVSGDIAH